MNKKLLIGVLIMIAIGAVLIVISLTQKTSTQITPPEAVVENGWKSYDFPEVNLSLSAPPELSVRGEKIDDSAFTLYVDRGTYPQEEYYQLYGMYNLNTGVVNLEDLKTELQPDSIVESKIDDFPAVSGQYKGERNRFVTFILTDNGLFTLATSQPSKANQKLTNDILETINLR
jgi:hypothetical protein